MAIRRALEGLPGVLGDNQDSSHLHSSSGFQNPSSHSFPQSSESPKLLFHPVEPTMNCSFSSEFFSRTFYELVIAALMLFNKISQRSVASNNIIFLKENYSFIWLQRVLVAGLGIFSCGIQALFCTCGIQFPDQGLNLGPLH